MNSQARHAGLLGIVLVCTFVALNCRGESLMFLKVDGVRGESTNRFHPDEIDVISFAHSEIMPISSAGGGGGIGRVSMTNLFVKKYLDKSSPDLLLACARGTHIQTVYLYVAYTSEPGQAFYTIKLTDVLVAGVGTVGESAGASAKPLEEVQFNFRRIDWMYRARKADGTLDAPIIRWFDLATNTGA